MEEALAGRDMSILLRAEYTENLVLLMHRFAKVPSFLLVPPVVTGVSEGSLNAGRVLVAAVLYRILEGVYRVEPPLPQAVSTIIPATGRSLQRQRGSGPVRSSPEGQYSERPPEEGAG